MSIQFDFISKLQAPQIGLLWSIFRKKFPNTEQHSPVDPIIEHLGPPSPPKIQIEISNVPPVPQCWFLNEAGSEIIKVQPNRFTHNWRKISSEDVYPRYEHVRNQFLQELTEFCAFLNNEGLGELNPNQCEVTYVNYIEPNNIWDNHRQLGNVLTVWNQNYSDDFLSDAESVRIGAQHVIKTDEGEPIGRLRISAQSAYSVSNNDPVLVVDFTARGAPIKKDLEGVLAFMDKGREMIVRGFASITTIEMHKYWGRIR